MRKGNTWIQSTLAATCAALLVAACGGGGDDSAATGTLRTAMTDAPSCGYDNVFVTVDRIRVNNSATASPDSGGWSELVLDQPRQIDLLDLQNGVIEELGELTLPVGRIQQVRFVLVDNATANPADIDFDPDADPTRAPNHVVFSAGGFEELKTPSGQQSGVKINVGIDVAEGQVADLLIDFDACKSVVEAGNSGNYLLKPVLTAIPRLSSGVRGTVADALLTSGAEVSISLQQDGEVIRSTAPIESADLDENGNFILAQVEPGTYDLVFTAPGFITKVVTDVVVPEGQLVNLDFDTTTPGDQNEIVLLPATLEGDAVGTVTNTDDVKPATFVEITQTLTEGATVLITSAQLSFETFDSGGVMTGVGDTAGYSFTLPVDAPEVAPYTATGVFNFNADTGVEGEYTVMGVAEPVDLTPVVQTAAASFDPAFVGTVDAPREVITNDFDFSSSPAP